jgi:hypothetical protein
MFVLGLFQVRVAEAVADPCCEVQSANALLPSSFVKKIQEKKKGWFYDYIEIEFGLLRR